MHTNDHHKINTATTKDNTNKNFTTLRTTSAAPTQACAACKYCRRKCTSDCILSPYFPHDRHPQFLNAHRLFGVSNIIKIIHHLTPLERDLAMRTIVFESDEHATDPGGGCYRIIRELELQISLAKAELGVVLHHLAICRAAAAAQRQVTVIPPDAGDLYDERWTGMEDEIGHDMDSSFPHHGRRLSPDESTHDMIKPILDHLACDDFREEFK